MLPLQNKKYGALSLLASTLVLPLVSAIKPTTLPGGYIVEFTTGDKSEFYSKLTGSNIAAEHRLDLNHELFKGVSFMVDSAQDTQDTVDRIQSMDMVSKIWPVNLYSKPAFFHGAIGDSQVQKRALHPYADTYSPHVMGSVDKLHAEGYTGDGLFIGVVDTGVDYNHPALGGGFGPGFKVVEGYDLVGDDYTGDNTPVPDPDPFDCDGHGTHVSGIIAAGTNPYNFTGVAPNATLGMWKVFGCTGQVSNDVLIVAFNMAYEAGVDLISSSIGGSSGWVEDAWDVAVQRIAENGVPCIIAAGNDGANGLFDSSSAAESIGATAVGSIDNTHAPAILYDITYTVDGGAAEDAYYALGFYGDFGNITAPLYAVTLDSTVLEDACDPLPGDTPDLSDYVVLIKRGVCTFDTKIANAVAYGANKIMFYNNVATPPTSPGDTSTTIPVGMVSAAQGAVWVSELAAGEDVVLTFQSLTTAVRQFTDSYNNVTGGTMSTFTSWGPSNELWIKPEVSAPGGSILSTLPIAKGSYGVESGTSMATPFISGVVALIKQVRGLKALTPDQLTSILASTATPVKFNDGTTTYDFLAPVVQQGGGLVNAYDAAHTTTLLDLDNIALNDTTYFKADHPVTIYNIGNTTVQYSFENLIAPTAFTLDAGSNFPVAFPPSLNLTGASVSFTPANLSVPAGASGIVTAHFTLPEGLDPTLIPVYSGYVAISGSNGESLSLPYAGVANRMVDVVLMDYADGFPYITTSIDDTESPIGNNTKFVLPTINSTSNATSTGLPTILYALAMGSRIVRIDVVPENTSNSTTILGEKALGSIATYPAEIVPRNELITVAWDGELADGSYAPAGKYKFLIRLLKIFGDQTSDLDYEKYETPYITISYA